jgi:hypothetical protein
MREKKEFAGSCEVLIICIGCRVVLDEQAMPPRWCSTAEHSVRSQSIVDDFVLLESYCPVCDYAYDRLIQYGQTEIPLCL